MATKKAPAKPAKKVAATKAAKKQYAWCFDDGDCMIGNTRFDSIDAALKSVEQCDPDGHDNIIVLEIIKKYRATASVILEEIK